MLLSCVRRSLPLVVWVHDCDQGPCVDGLGLFGHLHICMIPVAGLAFFSIAGCAPIAVLSVLLTARRACFWTAECCSGVLEKNRPVL